ncbi:MAG TPA: universal stress protein [Baekduia sp.]|nr:universal stress protein [Baekduia sp.]
MTHPIVVAVSEGAEAQEAVALGVTAARLFGAPLVLAGVAVVVAPAGATVVPGWSPPTDDTHLREYVANELHRQADAVPDDVSCTIQVATATGVLPGLEIIAEKEEAQLVVVGASHLGPLARAVHGDIGLGAVRHVGCSVLVVPSAGTVVSPPRRIGVAWDGGDAAETALELGAALAERSGAQLTILRAAEAGGATVARAALEGVANRFADRCRCVTELLLAPAAGALVTASADVDLLVVGARTRKLPASLWLGSVSTLVLRHARCPVLVVSEGARVPASA